MTLLLINANVESLSLQPSWKLLEAFHLKLFFLNKTIIAQGGRNLRDIIIDPSDSEIRENVKLFISCLIAGE